MKLTIHVYAWLIMVKARHPLYRKGVSPNKNNIVHIVYMFVVRSYYYYNTRSVTIRIHKPIRSVRVCRQ
jgi:hypothetical protein